MTRYFGQSAFLLGLLIMVFMATLTCLPSLAQQKKAIDRPIKDKWALVIGINKFEDPSIPELQYSAKDAQDFANFLITKGNFASDHVLTLLNQEATDDNILKAIADGWLPKRALPDDLIVIYVSTHGSPKEIDQIGKDNFLIAYNTHRDSLFSTGVRLKDLAKIARSRTRCERIVLLLDACNSGAAEAGGKGLYRAGNFDIGTLVGEGQIVISSSSANQRSWESKRYKNGVFTKKLMDALSKKGEKTTIPEAFDSLKDDVLQEVRFDRSADQTPLMKSKWSGKALALLAKPTSPRATLPYLKKTKKIRRHSPTTQIQKEVIAINPNNNNYVQKEVIAINPNNNNYAQKEVIAINPANNTVHNTKYVQAVDEPTRNFQKAVRFAKIKDFKQAFEWYLKAAKSGHAGAQGQVGCMYISGAGVNQNGDEGVKWLEKAASAGDLPAMSQLGSLYLRGHFVKKDFGKATELIQTAAQQGNKQAKYFLGCMYLTGSGVDKDTEKAKQWLQQAAEEGIAKANVVLEKLGENAVTVKASGSEGTENDNQPSSFDTTSTTTNGQVDSF